MSESVYLHQNTAIINFNEEFYRTSDDLIASKGFRVFMHHFLDDYKKRKSYLYDYLTQGLDHDSAIDEIIEAISIIQIRTVKSIKHPLLDDIPSLKRILEDAYVYWRNFQRCSIAYARTDITSFIDLDSVYNGVVLGLYRTIQEKLSEKKNKVYRQLKAGTNASVLLKRYPWNTPDIYQGLKSVYTLESVVLHSPLILHPKTNKREGHFQETFTNPIAGLTLNSTEFYCYPAKIGSTLAFVYFHRDFMFSGLSLANLFEMADKEEIETRKPDILIVFGIDDGSHDMVFYHDHENEMVVAKIAYQDKIEYFGYMKKIMLTAYNVFVMSNGWLPIHGAMVNVTFRDGKKRGVVFMGDSGAGKSETLEEITNISGDQIQKMEVIFDDMGSFHFDGKQVVAQGTEIGAFVRLDDLDRALPYKEMDRSIFMNPESTVNARVIVPVTDTETVSSNHPVDFFLYANNYESRIGVEVFAKGEGKQVFIDGKRMAKGTTHEVGLTTSFFANPFGPLQQEELCRSLIDSVFEALSDTGVIVGQVFTNLGVSDHAADALKQSAVAVLKLLEEN